MTNKFRDLGKKIAIDVETNGLDWNIHTPFGIAIADEHSSMYFDVRKTPGVVFWLNNLLKKGCIEKIVNHNIKFDIHMLRQIGILLDPEICECTQIRAALINEHLKSYSLDALSKEYLAIQKDTDIYDDLAKIFGGIASRNVQAKNFAKAPFDLMERYAKKDVEVALELHKWQESEIEKQDLHEIWEFEKRLFPNIIKMEKRGVRIDVAKAEEQMINLTKEIDLLQKYLNSCAKKEININSSNSLKLLFEPKQNKDGNWATNDGSILLSTEKKEPSFSSDSLKRVKNPLAKTVLKIRKLLKTRDTFVRNHILAKEYKGRVFPTINQARGENGGTITGRFSYTSPALQQIPAKDKEIAAIVRPIFLPDEDQKWSYGDMDQFEFRMFSHYVNNARIINEYKKNPDLDFHQKIADLTGLPRSAPSSGGPNAKQLNLGSIYQMGAGQLAHDVGLEWEWATFVSDTGKEIRYKKAGPEALELVNQYHKIVPGVKELANKAKNIAKSRGYIKSIMGRHLRFPNGYGIRKASTLLCQGSSADINKLNIIDICEYLKNEYPEAKLILNVHDEYSISLPDDFEKNKKHLTEIRKKLENRSDLLRVPVRIDFSRPSANWLAATLAEKIT